VTGAGLAPRSGALVLHEEISPGALPERTHAADDGTLLWEPIPAGEHRDTRRGCPRWPEVLWLRSSLGELVQGRCGATNLCEYCSKLGAMENTEMLWLDALQGVAPSIYICLTTRSTDPRPSSFYKSRELIQRDLRARWPTAELAWLLEFTTGKGQRSGGRRRPHWNGLLKGVPDDDLAEAREMIVTRWCSREDALAFDRDGKPLQEVSLIRDVGGLTKYLAQHFQKQSQKPPEGWSGHRFTKSRGYLWLPTPEARAAARESLKLKRALWRAERDGLVGEEAERSAAAAMLASAVVTWELVQLNASRPLTDAERTPPAPAPEAAGRTDLPGSGRSARADARRSRAPGARPTAPASPRAAWPGAPPARPSAGRSERME
jgi:hypothetical protein